MDTMVHAATLCAIGPETPEQLVSRACDLLNDELNRPMTASDAIALSRRIRRLVVDLEHLGSAAMEKGE